MAARQHTQFEIVTSRDADEPEPVDVEIRDAERFDRIVELSPRRAEAVTVGVDGVEDPTPEPIGRDDVPWWADDLLRRLGVRR
ncbi:hypothetical protein [Halobaculum sp. D14]|uniref:hypothetical protein n=1 Tax=Halobaculum sp. D14 TaxID=3421642 RepID=UPI003EB6F964